MTTVRTNLRRVEQESARDLRVEQVGSITAINVQKALEALQTQITLLIGGGNQRLVTSAANLPIVAGDTMINLNCSAPLSISVPLASSRNGARLTFKDVGGGAASNNITLNRTGADTFDGATSIVISVNYEGITLVPANDGTTSGWSVE